MPEPETGPRTIRTFVRRSGRMTPGQTRALSKMWSQYGIDYSEQPLDLATVFGRVADRVLEIGFGNGENLVQQARDNAHLDFIGIEVHEPGVGHCLIGAREAGATNLKVIMHDAIDVLRHQLPDNSLSRISLLFPDPWPKKRHHKRRIVQESFLELAAAKLTGNGWLHIATDWKNYADHIDEVIGQSASFRVVERNVHAGDKPLGRSTTKFETRGLKKGHKIVDWRLNRI